MVFEVTSYEIISKELTKTVYMLKLVSDDWNKWCNHVTLAGKDIHSRLIQKLMAKSGYKLTANSVTSKEPAIDFVTPTNFKLLDSVQYVLDRYYNDRDGILYLKRNFTDRKFADNDYTLKSIRSISDKQNDKFNLFTMQTPGTLADDMLSVRDFKESNYHNHEASVEYSRSFNLMKYDYDSGTMKNFHKSCKTMSANILRILHLLHSGSKHWQPFAEHESQCILSEQPN